MTSLRLNDGKSVAVLVRRSPRARRILLHVDAYTGAIELVLPRRTSLVEGLAFARSKTAWLESRLDEIAPAVPFADGASLPLCGRDIRIRHEAQLFEEVWRKNGTLVVAGDAARLPAQVETWLRGEAARIFAPLAQEKAERLGAQFRRIIVRDPRTRWGSCSLNGDLAFSWRLVMAPRPVLDYVVAHEVAHLRVMNHSRRFWSLVEKICDDVEKSRDWLRTNGAALHRYGLPPS
jgi:predicted metal-dependent hydrolase